jgi:uncharacterized protein
VSRQNVEVVRRLTEARARDSKLSDAEIDWLRRPSDSEVYRELMAPDVEIDMSRRVFNPEVFRGLEGMARLREEIREVWEEWRMTPERFLDVGDCVVLIEHVHGRARGSGVELDIPSASIWTLRDGRVTRVEGASTPSRPSKPWGWKSRGCRRRMLRTTEDWRRTSSRVKPSPNGRDA